MFFAYLSLQFDAMLESLVVMKRDSSVQHVFHLAVISMANIYDGCAQTMKNAFPVSLELRATPPHARRAIMMLALGMAVRA